MSQLVINFDNISLLGNWLILVFLVLIVAISAVFIPKFLISFLGKYSHNSVLLGVFLLSIITSLPEILTIFIFPLISKTVSGGVAKAFANIIGSNIIAGVFLCLLTIVFWKKVIMEFIPREIRITTVMALCLNIFFFTILIKGIVIKNQNWQILSFVMITLYFLFTLYSGWRMRHQRTSKMELRINLFKFRKIKSILLIWTAFLIAILVGAVFMIMELTNHLQKVYNLSNQTVGGVFFALATTSPEIWTALSLFSYGFSNAALGVIVGSHLFNFILFFALELSVSIDIGKMLISNVDTSFVLANLLVIGAITMTQTRKINQSLAKYLIVPFLLSTGLPIVFLT